MSQYPKGSEWRKWDLHVHTPKSIVQEYGGDNKAAWDAFIKKLASLPAEVKVIGVTDYLFVDGYEYLLSRRNEIPNIDLIIPNIEFRLSTFSGTAHNTKRHNFHVLFDPSVSPQEIKDQLLNGLSKGYKIQDGVEWLETPTPRSLEKLGAQIKAVAPAGNSIHSKTDLEVGFDNITYDRKDIEKNLAKTTFKGKYVVAIGYSEWDQSKWDQSAVEKRDLINKSHFCLTSLDDPAKINQNVEDLRANKLNSVVLHSSDAHKIERIGQSSLWIKADPTFAGLKQVINEPERVYIGDVPPNLKHSHQIISKIKIQRSSGWFKEPFELEINRDLVAIIGGRGSGKSALAEMIAYGAGSLDPNKNSFIKKAAQHKESIEGTSIKLTWEDGSDTEHPVGGLSTDLGLVRYLPQNSVEELCSPENSEFLQEQIEDVIFQSLDETNRMGASDFKELKNRILKRFENEIAQNYKKIRDINKKIKINGEIIKSVSGKQATLKSKQAERAKLISSLPKLPEADQKGQEELSKLIDQRTFFEDKIVEIQKIQNKLFEIESNVQILIPKLEEYETELRVMGEEAGLSNLDIFKITMGSVEIEKALSFRKKEIADLIGMLKKGDKEQVLKVLGLKAAQLTFVNLDELDKEIGKKQKETKAYESQKLKYQQQKKLISTLDVAIKALESEIKDIEKKIAPESDTLKKEGIERYINHFQILEKEREEIERLYKPLQEMLSIGTETDRKLKFEAKIDYKLDQHLEQGLGILDRTRKGNFRGETSNLKSALNALWEAFYKGDYKKDAVLKGLQGIAKKFTESEGKEISIEEQLRSGLTMEDFRNWIYDPTLFDIISSLKFDGTDLYLLSPGQKGIVLLILFLEIDKGDYRPLIIDQPEENLDNLSVYNDLITFFRDRKQYRQIIMITHNPNLVVNTDAEQVVVANYNGTRNPRLEYVSGSIEDQAIKKPDLTVEEFEDGIIEQVCSILEGGEAAFGKRKDKYKISQRYSFDV